MLVLHGFWSASNGLCLWAEDSTLTVTSSSDALRSARPHPFAAPADAIAAIHAGKPAAAVLLLPSLRKSPLDSPELFRVTPRPAPRSEAVLLSWTVPVMSLPAASALTALDEPAADVRYGASVAYLADLALFARELVERGRVLPALSCDEHGPAAIWRPVVQGPDIVTLNSLIAAMPPVCRAEPETQDGHELATSALNAFVDAAVRSRLPAGIDLLPPRRGRRPKHVPAEEAWLAALTAPDGRFDSDPGELDELAEALQPWDAIGADEPGPARAMFRLTDTEGPHGQQPAWRLEFLLQSMADPSLLVPAEQTWDEDGSLRRWLDRPQELLLGELGRAVRIYPELAPALRTARPSEILLDTDGAYHFLSTAAPLLDEAGFGVLLPAWWDRRRRLGIAVSAHTPVDGIVRGTSRFGRDQLIDFQWKLAVGDDTLTDDEIAALAETKAPLIRLRGQWVAVDPEQLRRGVEFLARNPTGQATTAEILALAASHPADTDTPLEVTAVRADGWLGDLLSGAAAQSLRPLAPPPEFAAVLRPYQQRGLSWLAFLSSLGLGSCLADDMGLGKTVQLLALESAQRHDEPGTGPTLLLCPMSLVGNWQREAAKFAPALRVYAHHGTARLRGDALREHLADIDVVVTTYATATRDIDELAAFRWNRVVLDEAQAVKNSLSRGAKAVRRLEAAHRVALTGTPVENRLAELWSIMDFLNPGLLGSSEVFRTRFAIPVEKYGQTEPAERLRKITRPYVLRRLKTDPTIIDDLPEKIEIKQYCQLTAEQASLYQSIVDEMMEKIENTEGIERRGNVLAAMAKLKQVCNHPAQLLHDRSPVGARSGKVIRLEEILEEILAEGDRVLCFTQFTEFAQMLVPHLAARFGQDVAYLHGGTPKNRRDQMVARFQSGDGPSIFLLSLKAGGTGLNLTAANHVVHLDRWWNPAVENQATDRAFRIGQKRKVQVRKFICTGTLEEKIDDMIEKKKALADLVVGDGEGWLTELSTGDLRKLFALSEGAVGE
ncbi:DEAD/DEAH box helicase [Candidatus Mycolicibacterium alkanivorans]|uniref:DEAD/DEAH box helicase n=1 Tax=Candidatus Mycolicibacterium alkanivorans TaxID=2954114 RepID=A0ABS9YU26_9MYCO|nr:DEAD/DEAH box helicase [Candidatus Mycolicibacterium alkanivorans]MCI4674720.1 DEAD/DEAH box helicase [Candidatus Mycolicibacterium alkanivorans]